MWTVCVETADKRRVLGRNRGTLGQAERLALQRAAGLPSDTAALILDNGFNVAARYPGQLPAHDIIESSVTNPTKAVGTNRGRATRRTVVKRGRARKGNR